MGKFNYTKEEKNINKVLKYNQLLSNNCLQKTNKMLNDIEMKELRNKSDQNIAESIELLRSFDIEKNFDKLDSTNNIIQTNITPKKYKECQSWHSLVAEANEYVHGDIEIEDLLSIDEINSAIKYREEIEKEFSQKTSIFNKIDLSFLAIATGIQVAKALVFPYIAESFGYGESFDPSERLAHDDKIIEQEHKDANKKFVEEHLKHHRPGYWINLLYMTPPYDITTGSVNLGINMGGKYHRLHTLGHDPILGWIFGTANILTDIITFNDFQSFRVIRKPKMIITPEEVSMGEMFGESYQIIKEDYLNLAAAVFAQACHYKSDEFTKVGLPVPILSSFNEDFANDLYKSQYDMLCFSRDVKIIGVSFIISQIINIIIGLIHSLFRKEYDDSKLFRVRTRKILLISNCIASSSSVIATCITKNPKQLDIGGLLATIGRLFFDIRFILKIKEEFIQSEIEKKLKYVLNETDELYDSIFYETTK